MHLRVACMENRVEDLKKLIELDDHLNGDLKTSALNFADTDGFRPIHHACYEGHSDILQLITEKLPSK